MSRRLDEELAHLAAFETDQALDGLEGEVGRSIARLRAEARSDRLLLPLRAAAVGLAVAVGVSAGVGVAAAHRAPQPIALAMGADLAPSNLLRSLD